MGRPTKEQLNELYSTQRLSTRAIAEIYGVSHTSIKRWLRLHDIPRRPNRPSLSHRGIEEPDPETLRHMVHVEHLSYRTIARHFGISASGVHLWIDRYGIDKPTVWQTRRKGKALPMPDRAELHKLYVEDRLSHQAIGDLYGVSGTTIGTLAAKYSIKSKESGFNGGVRWVCEDGHRVRSSYEHLVDNWLYQHNIAHEYEPKISFDKRRKADFLANGWYIEVWGITNSDKYTRRKKEKTSLYHANHLPLIEIPARSFTRVGDKSWERRLQPCLEPFAYVQLSLSQ